MRYVDAGYVIALAVLALYAAVLVLRRRRLERAAGAPQGATVGPVTHRAGRERAPAARAEPGAAPSVRPADGP